YIPWKSQINRHWFWRRTDCCQQCKTVYRSESTHPAKAFDRHVLEQKAPILIDQQIKIGLFLYNDEPRSLTRSVSPSHKKRLGDSVTKPLSCGGYTKCLFNIFPVYLRNPLL